jgi:hypothetical protein
VPVTFSNRDSFIELALAARLHEYDEHIAAIRRGLANIVPIRALTLFTWQQLEVLVCGEASIDPAFLKLVRGD